MRKSAIKPPKPVFHTPTQMDWTDDKLAALSNDQLVTLLGNLRTQRASGRVKEDTADELAKLTGLRDSGVLSDEEFATQKAKLLAQ